MKFDRPSEPTVQQVHDGLQRLFRQAGRGSVKRVESALGVAEGSFRQWRRRGKLPLEILFRTLEELKVPPGGFWVEVLGSNLDPVDLARRPSGLPQDPVVRRAILRWEAPDDPQTPAMTEQRLSQLDDLRRRDPKLAVRHAKAALRTSKRVWLPRLLAVYGTARRAESKIDIALEALRYALQLAEQTGAFG